MYFLIVLEIADDDKTDDDEEEPRGDFVGTHDVPYVYLIGILPRPPEGRDILRDPNKEGDEAEGEGERH